MKNFRYARAVMCANETSATSVQDLLANGLAHHKEGRLDEAAKLYRDTLERQPNNVDALNLLGVAELASGRAAAAIGLLEKAVKLAPQYSSALSNLGNAYLADDKVSEAIGAYEQALKFDSNNSEIRYNLANCKVRIGDLEGSLEQYDRAVQINPTNASAWFNQANAFAADGQHELALKGFQKAHELAPANLNVINNYGVSLVALNRLDEAEALFRKAISIDATDGFSLNNLGSILSRRGLHDQAAPILQEAVKYRPEDVTAWTNLAISLADRHLKWALVAVDRVLELKPEDPASWALLGNAHLRYGEHKEAAEAFRKAIKIDPSYLQENNNVGIALSYSRFVDEAILYYKQRLLRCPDDAEAWADSGISLMNAGRLDEAIDHLKTSLKIDPNNQYAHSNLLLTQCYSPEYPPARLLDEASQWAQVHTASLQTTPARPSSKSSGSKLRVGYLSADFHQHPAGRLYRAMFPHHDRSKFDFTIYANQECADEVTKDIVETVDRWLIVKKMSDRELVERIQEDEIDILVDLLGHTPNHRLKAFAMRAAPVQASWLGYFGTTGIPEIDFILADNWVLPTEHEQFFTERPARLEGCLYVFQPPTFEIPLVAPPCIKNGHTTFGCFNNTAKITQETIMLWARVLKQIPGSRLVLNRWQFESEGVRDRYTQLFEAQEIDPARIDFLATTGQEAYLSSYNEVDLMLDTIPFGGGTTTLECLWMGVPVISLSTDRFAGRMTESILHAVGISELLPANEDQFIEFAKRLAADEKELTRLRKGLRTQVESSQLCDIPGFTRRLENTFEWMWENRAKVEKVRTVA